MTNLWDTSGMYEPGPGITTRDVDTYRKVWVKDWVRVGITERSAEEYADLIRGMARMNRSIDMWKATGEPSREERPDLFREIHLGHDDMIDAALTLREWSDGIPQRWMEQVSMAVDDPRLMRPYPDCARCRDHEVRHVTPLDRALAMYRDRVRVLCGQLAEDQSTTLDEVLNGPVWPEALAREAIYLAEEGPVAYLRYCQSRRLDVEADVDRTLRLILGGDES